ncbi:MAG: OmpA family protein [Nannocystales bacterium]
MTTSKRTGIRNCFFVLALWSSVACATQGTTGANPEPSASYVYFASAAEQPLKGQTDTLASAAAALDADPWLRAVIVGHTDSDGDPEYNRDLAFRRAAEIQVQLEELSELEVSDRTRLAYYGEERPLANNEDEDGKAQNRRVQIYFFHHRKDEGDEDHLRRVFGSKLKFSASAEISAQSK